MVWNVLQQTLQIKYVFLNLTWLGLEIQSRAVIRTFCFVTHPRPFRNIKASEGRRGPSKLLLPTAVYNKESRRSCGIKTTVALYNIHIALRTE